MRVRSLESDRSTTAIGKGNNPVKIKSGLLRLAGEVDDVCLGFWAHLHRLTLKWLLHQEPEAVFHTGNCSCIHPGVSSFGSVVKSITSRSSTIRLLTGFERRARSAFATRRIARVKSRRDL